MIDKLDLAIIASLEEDGRRTYTSLSAETGASEATVRARMTKLIDIGILQIVALSSPLLLGWQPLRVYIKVGGSSPTDIANRIAKLSSANTVAIVSGEFDVYVEATCRDLNAGVEFLDMLRSMPQIGSMEVTVLTRLIKDYSWTGLRERTRGSWRLTLGQSESSQR